MVDVARRFEVAGRAVVANRFELAEFEAGEVGELFETEIPEAELPKEGPTAHIRATAKAFLTTNVPELQKAAAEGDAEAAQILKDDPLGDEPGEGLSQARLPFGPFLILSLLELLFFGERISRWYQSLVGLR